MLEAKVDGQGRPHFFNAGLVIAINIYWWVYSISLISPYFMTTSHVIFTFSFIWMNLFLSRIPITGYISIIQVDCILFFAKIILRHNILVLSCSMQFNWKCTGDHTRISLRSISVWKLKHAKNLFKT